MEFISDTFVLSYQARDRMYAMLDSVISKRRSGGGFQKDFLESLIMKHSKAAGDEDDKDKLTDKQLKDNILTLLVAGHDTTTAALTWLIKFLGENPSVLEQLRVMYLATKAKFSLIFDFHRGLKYKKCRTYRMSIDKFNQTEKMEQI